MLCVINYPYVISFIVDTQNIALIIVDIIMKLLVRNHHIGLLVGAPRYGVVSAIVVELRLVIDAIENDNKIDVLKIIVTCTTSTACNQLRLHSV